MRCCRSGQGRRQAAGRASWRRRRQPGAAPLAPAATLQGEPACMRCTRHRLHLRLHLSLTRCQALRVALSPAPPLQLAPRCTATRPPCPGSPTVAARVWSWRIWTWRRPMLRAPRLPSKLLRHSGLPRPTALIPGMVAVPGTSRRGSCPASTTWRWRRQRRAWRRCLPSSPSLGTPRWAPSRLHL